jgi:hypothetical protein
LKEKSMTKKFPIRLAVTAVALACASTAGAQQADTRTLAKPAVDAASCTEIDWQEQILARYPNIAAACQEVVVSNDARFARFDGELVQVNRDGSVKIDFKDRDGDSLGKPTTLQLAPNQRALIEGRYYRFSELMPGQQLNLYIPEAGVAVATELGAPPESMAKIVPDELNAPADATREPVRLAETTPPPAEAQATRLPDTAGWSPLLALAGVLALGGGMALTARRRLRKTEMA